jgi:hypothetical protein
MKFVIPAFIGSVSAVSLEYVHASACNACNEAPACDQGCGGYISGYGQGYNLGDRNAVLSGADRTGAFAKLTSESAGSNTNIVAQNIVIPDKHTVTDQAKVSESTTRGSHQEQNCEVTKKTYLRHQRFHLRLREIQRLI